tara:strand:+ start:835 stop:1419 length:585 start_codon:yes stop_codon:yes gene_type:complete
MYFSALKENDKLGIDFSRVGTAPRGVPYKTNNRNIVMAWDIADGLPNIFGKCDIIYTETAWSRGLRKYNEMAKSHTSFDTYMQAMSILPEVTGKPCIFVCGKEGSKYFKNTSYSMTINLNGKPAIGYVFNTERIYTNRTTELLLRTLAKEYDCVGDPCCGLGSTGRVFNEAGKIAVMSDYNGKCIRFLLSQNNR